MLHHSSKFLERCKNSNSTSIGRGCAPTCVVGFVCATDVQSLLDSLVAISKSLCLRNSMVHLNVKSSCRRKQKQIGMFRKPTRLTCAVSELAVSARSLFVKTKHRLLLSLTMHKHCTVHVYWLPSQQCDLEKSRVVELWPKKSCGRIFVFQTRVLVGEPLPIETPHRADSSSNDCWH